MVEAERLAGSLGALGRHDEARVHQERALAIREGRSGWQRPSLLIVDQAYSPLAVGLGDDPRRAHTASPMGRLEDRR